RTGGVARRCGGVESAVTATMGLRRRWGGARKSGETARDPPGWTDPSPGRQAYEPDPAGRAHEIHEVLAGVTVSVSSLVITTAVILLVPITRRMGQYLEVLIEKKRGTLRGGREVASRTAVDDLAWRIELLEERLEFLERIERTERLLTSAEPRELERREPAGSPPGRHPRRRRSEAHLLPGP